MSDKVGRELMYVPFSSPTCAGQEKSAEVYEMKHTVKWCN